jgi:LPXTG-motif cell wall-anchored protein
MPTIPGPDLGPAPVYPQEPDYYGAEAVPATTTTGIEPWHVGVAIGALVLVGGGIYFATKKKKR